MAFFFDLNLVQEALANVILRHKLVWWMRSEYKCRGPGCTWRFVGTPGATVKRYSDEALAAHAIHTAEEQIAVLAQLGET